MKIHYVKALIEEKRSSAKNSDAEKQVETIIAELTEKICSDESVSSLDDILEDNEVNPNFKELIKTLEYAV